jgi:hypothetical protein
MTVLVAVADACHIACRSSSIGKFVQMCCCTCKHLLGTKQYEVCSVLKTVHWYQVVCISLCIDVSDLYKPTAVFKTIVVVSSKQATVNSSGDTENQRRKQ